jgi:hypothetical protein
MLKESLGMSMAEYDASPGYIIRNGYQRQRALGEFAA